MNGARSAERGAAPARPACTEGFAPGEAPPGLALDARLRRTTGFTLLEMLVVCTISALLIGAATPGLWQWVAKHQTQAAAHSLLADIRDARAQAAQRGETVHVQVQGNCWSVGAVAPCDCNRQACGWRHVDIAKSFPGARVEREGRFSLTPQGTSASPGLQSIELASPAGARLQLRLPLLGSASLCAVDGGYTTVNACGK